MNFGDEFNWGVTAGQGNIECASRLPLTFAPFPDVGFARGSSVEVPEFGMHPSRAASQIREDVDVSQRSSLLPWDNVGISSSTNGEFDLPGPENDNTHKSNQVTVRYALPDLLSGK